MSKKSAISLNIGINRSGKFP